MNTDLDYVDIAELVALGVEAYASADSLRARVLSSAQLRARSRGEVTKPETINARTEKPERDGLFCARIFGPVEDLCCLCTKYQGEQHRAVRCEKCGVEVLPSAVRRERFGHITLAVPIVHPLLRAGVARLLKLSVAQLQQISSYEARFEGPGVIAAEGCDRIAGEALREALAAVDVEAMYADAELAPLADNLTPAQLMLETLAVLPAGLRPIDVTARRHAGGDLNDLYRRVINRNNRLRRLRELAAPNIILLNEARMLQETVDHLFINERTAKPLVHREQTVPSLEARALARLAELPGAPPSIAALLRAGSAGMPAMPSTTEDEDEDEDQYGGEYEDEDYDF